MPTRSRYARALLALLLVTGCAAPDDPPAASLADLDGRTFSLVSTGTDDGGGNHMFADASFVITFHGSSATAQTSCGTIEYPEVTSGRTDGPGDFSVDLGRPVGPLCSLGRDPSDVPAGPLFWFYTEGRHSLSSGYVSWRFDEITAR